MRASVVVTNYNYGRFLGEALTSVARQTYGDVEVVVVDDGSTDKSRRIIEDFSRELPVKAIFKSNGGQLSSFNAAVQEVSGDVVFFLDADDLFNPTYVERAMAIFREDEESDFLFVAVEYFGDVPPGTRQPLKPREKSYGITLLRTMRTMEWIGAATSALSMRRWLFDALLPIPLEKDWRVRADDCLIWGASLLGGVKRSTNEKLVRYRVHGENLHFGSSSTAVQLYRREQAVNRLFHHFLPGNNPRSLDLLFPFEVKTIPCLDWKDFVSYLKVLYRSSLPLADRIHHGMCLVQHLIDGRRRPR